MPTDMSMLFVRYSFICLRYALEINHFRCETIDSVSTRPFQTAAQAMYLHIQFLMLWFYNEYAFGPPYLWDQTSARRERTHMHIKSGDSISNTYKRQTSAPNRFSPKKCETPAGINGWNKWKYLLFCIEFTRRPQVSPQLLTQRICGVCAFVAHATFRRKLHKNTRTWVRAKNGIYLYYYVVISNYINWRISGGTYVIRMRAHKALKTNRNSLETVRWCGSDAPNGQTCTAFDTLHRSKLVDLIDRIDMRCAVGISRRVSQSAISFVLHQIPILFQLVLNDCVVSNQYVRVVICDTLLRYIYRGNKQDSPRRTCPIGSIDSGRKEERERAVVKSQYKSILFRHLA